MKFQNNSTNFNQATNIKFENSLEFNLDKKNMSKLFYMLRDGFYSHKIQTMVQEYMSNARDSHRVAKNNNPIEIVLPSETNPSLIIRDFGTGMGLNELKVFASYLESSKDKDDSQTGGFGIGGKIGFCYTDSFVIVSRKDGKEYTIVANKDQSENGIMNLLPEKETNSANGVEVIIPIKQQDFNEVSRSVIRCSMFWEVKPRIVNDKILDKKLETLTSQNSVFKTNNFSLLTFKEETGEEFSNFIFGDKESHPELFISVDAIVYQLSQQMIQNIKHSLHEDSFIYKLIFERKLSTKCQFAVHMNTSEIRVVANRESIENKEFNLKNIVNKLNLIEKEIQSILFNKIERELNPSDAMNFLTNVFYASVDINPSLLIRSFNNKEEILLENTGFYLKDTANLYSINTSRTKYNTVNNLTVPLFYYSLVDKTQFHSWFGSQRIILYFNLGHDDQMSTSKIKSKLKQNRYSGKYDVVQLNDALIEKLNNLNLLNLNSNYLDFSKEKKKKQLKRKIEADKVNCYLVTDISSGISEKSYSRYNNQNADYLKEAVDVNVSEKLDKAIFTSNENFKKFANCLTIGDCELLKENNVEFYILGEKTLEEVNKKYQVKSLENISDLIKTCNRSKEYSFFNPNLMEIQGLNFESEDSLIILNYLIYKNNKDLKNKIKDISFDNKFLKELQIENKFIEIKNKSKLNILKSSFENIFKEEYKSLKNEISKITEENPFILQLNLDHSFLIGEKQTFYRTDNSDKITKNIEKILFNKKPSS